MAVVLPNGVVADAVEVAVAYDGVGSDGIVTLGNSIAKFGTAHVFIYTGSNPEPYGYFTISTVGRVALGQKPICLLSAAWTNDEYANGYPTPVWPMHSLQQHQYDTKLGTVSFRWDAVLSPLSNYSINVYCGKKLPK